MELVSRWPSLSSQVTDVAKSVEYSLTDRLEIGDKAGHRFLVFRSGIRLTGKAWSVRLSSTTIRGNCVAILYRLLILLIVARTGVPPSMCLCKLEAPASRAVAWLLRTDMPDLPQHEEDDDHHPGCPASYLSLGLGLRPIPFLEPPPLFLSDSSFTPSLPATTLVVAVAPRTTGFPADPPLYVSHCALTV